MINERYSIEVDNENIEVLIHGHLSVEELLDFIELYRKQGFKYAHPGDENSCLRLTRKNFGKIPEGKESNKAEDKPEEELTLPEMMEKIVEDIRHQRAKKQVELLQDMLRNGGGFPWQGEFPWPRSCEEEKKGE